MLNFTKMHGAGNDYIYFNCFECPITNPEELAVRVSDRHFGIGGDGIVLIMPSAVADARMRMFNIDGSEGKMCGNAIRCVGKYIYDHGITDKTDITIETASGIKSLKLTVTDGKVSAATVNMGAPELAPRKIPVDADGKTYINKPLCVDGKSYDVTCVSMGNPHAVLFVDDVHTLRLDEIGPKFEKHAFFPENVNTEFVRVISGNEIDMRVWERGSGETLACGTGSCASVVACCLNGYCTMGADVTVHLIGGDLKINWKPDGVYMTGPAVEVFHGQIEE